MIWLKLSNSCHIPCIYTCTYGYLHHRYPAFSVTRPHFVPSPIPFPSLHFHDKKVKLYSNIEKITVLQMKLCYESALLLNSCCAQPIKLPLFASFQEIFVLCFLLCCCLWLVILAQFMRLSLFVIAFLFIVVFSLVLHTHAHTRVNVQMHVCTFYLSWCCCWIKLMNERILYKLIELSQSETESENWE